MNIKKSCICHFIAFVLMCFPSISVFADPTSSDANSSTGATSQSSISQNSSSNTSSQQKSSTTQSSYTSSQARASNTQSSLTSSQTKSSTTQSSNPYSSSISSSPASSSSPKTSTSTQESQPSSSSVSTNVTSSQVPKTKSSTDKNSIEPSYNMSSVDYPQPFKWTEAPADLPEVDSSEITLPEVVASTDENNKGGFTAGIIAWVCIGIGVAIILFVIFSGKREGEISLNTASKVKKGKKSSKKLLSDKYYKNNY
ncbi:MAG: hypothetical protein RUMPE_00083 [Eubacteriales bacterium SKADARSKE-1]|nr:hypothetical protein [Eubacteriales bacterium SKADARSKE-1]